MLGTVHFKLRKYNEFLQLDLFVNLNLDSAFSLAKHFLNFETKLFSEAGIDFVYFNYLKLR